MVGHFVSKFAISFKTSYFVNLKSTHSSVFDDSEILHIRLCKMQKLNMKKKLATFPTTGCLLLYTCIKYEWLCCLVHVQYYYA